MRRKENIDNELGTQELETQEIDSQRMETQSENAKIEDDVVNLEDVDEAAEPGVEEPEEVNPRGRKQKKPKEKKSKKTKKRGRNIKSEELVRIEQLEKALADTDADIDVDAIVSMYIPHRRFKNFGAALLRLDKMYLWLLGMIAVIAILFITAFMQEKMGNFTINLNRLELFRKGVAIATDGQFSDATARLTANTVKDATNISIDDLPKELDQIDGQHNGKNYMAYTYYVRNAGKENLGYIASVKLDAASKGVEKAVRVAVWNNGKRTVYAAPAADGGKEKGCTSFESDSVVCSFHESTFEVGYVNKYTIVIWLEGDDPQCTDSIVGGSVQFSMSIDSDMTDDTNIFVKFVQDIKDTLFGDEPISAAGNDAPDYYKDKEVTWDNRANK